MELKRTKAMNYNIVDLIGRNWPDVSVPLTTEKDEGWSELINTQ